MTVRPPTKARTPFLQSFGTLRYIPRFFRLFWRTSPRLTAINIAVRLLPSQAQGYQ
jgi:hypothetical protein